MMNPSFSITLLTPADNEALEFCSSYLSVEWREPYEESLERWLKCARGEEKTFALIARYNNSPVGMIGCFPRPDFEADGVYEPWVAGLYVAKPYRRQGLGKMLIEEVYKEAKARGFEKVHLTTDKDHLREWYTRLGWEPVGKASWEEHRYDVFRYDLMKLKKPSLGECEMQ